MIVFKVRESSNNFVTFQTLFVDQITDCEELTRVAHDDAVRCQLFAAEAKSKECDKLIQVINLEIQKLQDGISVGNKELEKYQGKKIIILCFKIVIIFPQLDLLMLISLPFFRWRNKLQLRLRLARLVVLPSPPL